MCSKSCELASDTNLSTPMQNMGFCKLKITTQTQRGQPPLQRRKQQDTGLSCRAAMLHTSAQRSEPCERHVALVEAEDAGSPDRGVSLRFVHCDSFSDGRFLGRYTYLNQDNRVVWQHPSEKRDMTADLASGAIAFLIADTGIRMLRHAGSRAEMMNPEVLWIRDFYNAVNDGTRRLREADADEYCVVCRRGGGLLRPCATSRHGLDDDILYACPCCHLPRHQSCDELVASAYENSSDDDDLYLQALQANAAVDPSALPSLMAAIAKFSLLFDVADKLCPWCDRFLSRCSQSVGSGQTEC